jgi:hypothetical protein
MKKLYFILTFITITLASTAQEEQPTGEKIEALRVAFISKELELTPAEAEKFWPIYNEYANELKTLKKAAKNDDNPDVLENDEKILNLQKSYKDRFTKVLGQQRMNRFFSANKKFHQMLIKAAIHKRQRNAQPNRPLLRRNQ